MLCKDNKLLKNLEKWDFYVVEFEVVLVYLFLSFWCGGELKNKSMLKKKKLKNAS